MSASSSHPAAPPSHRALAAARFARASHVAAIPVATTGDEADINDYDAFLANRSVAIPVSAGVAVHDSTPGQVKDLNMDESNGDTIAPSSTSFSPSFSSLATHEFGAPLRPATTTAANRRYYYLHHHLMPPPDTTRTNAPNGTSSKASTNMKVVVPPLNPTYFDDDEMERRRPQLYHQYIGQFKRQRSGDKGDEEEEDEYDRSRRRGEMKNQEDEEDKDVEEESKMSDATTRDNQPHHPSSSVPSKRTNTRTPQHLPNSLSELLLTNYDRARYEAHVHEPQERNSAAASATTSSSKAASTRQRHPSVADSLLESDESEMDIDDDDAASRPPVVTSRTIAFHADDGVVQDADGSDLREKGPTSSGEYAEWTREMIDDDMDAREKRMKEREREEMEDEEKVVQQDECEPGAPAAASSTESPNFNPTAVVASSSSSSTSSAGRHTTVIAAAFHSSDESPSTITALRLEFIRLMHQLFLDGYDATFVDYTKIDADEENEDLTVRETHEQEAYFDRD